MNLFTCNKEGVAVHRLLWLDALKGLLIILVILGHSLQGVLQDGCHNSHVWNAIYSFHMSAFIALSGWVSYSIKPFNIVNSIIRRSRQLLLPYLLWSFLRYLVSFEHTQYNLYNIIIRPESYFWFLWVLFWICVFFLLCKMLSLQIKVDELYVIVGVGALLFVLMLLYNIRIFGFQLIAYYYIFYSFGYLVRRFSLFNYKKIRLPVLFVLWVLLAWSWKMHDLPSWMPTVSFVPEMILQYLYRGITAIIAFLFLVNIAPLCFNNINTTNILLANLGFASLGIYVVHIFMIDPLKSCISCMCPTMNSTFAIIIVFICAAIISAFFVGLIFKNKYAASVFLGKI